MRTFVIDWNAIDMQNAISKLEGLGHTVCGSAYQGTEQAEASIRSTHPDVVVAWANSHPERTQEVLRHIIHDVEGKDPAPLPVLFVDAHDADRATFTHYAAPAVFRDVAHLSDGLEEITLDIKKARKALEHAQAASGAASEEE